MSTHARPLADWLAAASDDELTTLFRFRGVSPDATWQDFFDAAESLLEPASVARALPTLTRTEAAALHGAASGADAGELRRPLTALALLQADGAPYPTVAAAVRDRPVSAEHSPRTITPADSDAAAHAAERAFTTVAAVADLVLQSRSKPFALLADGRLSAGEKKVLAENGVSAEQADALVALAVDAALLVPDERTLHATTIGDRWLSSSAGDRWSALVTGFRDALPRGIRSSTGGWDDPAAWHLAHPWDPNWPERSRALLERARLLGLIADDGAEPTWSEPLRAGGDVDASGLTALLPSEVDRIFLQNDLTAISPGPLAPALDVRLRTMTQRESAAQAASYRFTSESIADAFVAGETEHSILEFLGEISLTGIPQPLQYLIAQTAQRHGLVRVSTDGETGRTRIESVDEHLIEMIAVDQALRPLALTKHVGSITTRVGRDAVYWALTDARYPATLVDAAGTVITGHRHPSFPAPLAAPVEYTTLVEKLRAHQGPDADAAWLDRELDAAVKSHAVVKVTVGMPDGTTRELVMEATGLSGGRLRGRDRAADVERTLPVSSIRSATIVAQ